MNLSRGGRYWHGLLATGIATACFLLVSAYVCANPVSKGAEAALPHDGYAPPTASEMAAMSPRYLAELATIHEPPEITNTPMQARRPVPVGVEKVLAAIKGIRSPDKATPAQLEATLNELGALTSTKLPSDVASMVYGMMAEMTCFARKSPSAVITYATKAIGGGDSSFSNSMLALRARMYLAAGNKRAVLDDLQKLMVSDSGNAMLLGGETEPRKRAAPCDWSIPSLDKLADDPRGLAAKGLYLSAFTTYVPSGEEPQLEAQIRSLYARAEQSWKSPIPYFLSAVTINGLGSQEMMASAKCVVGPAPIPPAASCAVYDDDQMRDARELTMALVIDPKFGPALAARAEEYLGLAQQHYATGKPSLKLFRLAIADYTAAIAAPDTDTSVLYDDRGLALASVGDYTGAAASYVKGLQLAKKSEKKPALVYEQLAGVYIEMGRPAEAARTLTDGIAHSSTGLIDVVVLGGLQAFRDLYPEYDMIPDEIVAEDVRRRYEPQFPESWDSSFINSTSKVSNTDLAELYALRGDAYMKAGNRKAAAADYARLKSAAWSSNLNARTLYFDEGGSRNRDTPTPWPAPPPVQ